MRSNFLKKSLFLAFLISQASSFSLAPCGIVSSHCIFRQNQFTQLKAAESDGIKDISEMTQAELDALPDLMLREGVESVEQIMQENARFGFKMRALRGDFDSRTGEEDSERNNNLAEAVFAFPGPCTLKVVAKKDGNIVDVVLDTLRQSQGVEVRSHTIEERLSGKFVSLTIDAYIVSSEARSAACSQVLSKDTRVKMAF